MPWRRETTVPTAWRGVPIQSTGRQASRHTSWRALLMRHRARMWVAARRCGRVEYARVGKSGKDHDDSAQSRASTGVISPKRAVTANSIASAGRILTARLFGSTADHAELPNEILIAASNMNPAMQKPGGITIERRGKRIPGRCRAHARRSARYFLTERLTMSRA